MGERMHWSEAEAVVRAYRAERGDTDVDIDTLARALDTSVDEIRRLAGRKRRFIDRSGVISAALAFGVLGAAILAVNPTMFTKNPIFSRFAPEPEPTVIHLASPNVFVSPSRIEATFDFPRDRQRIVVMPYGHDESM